MAPDLTEVMLKRIEENTRQRIQEECKEIVQRSENLKSYLINIAKIGKWSLPLTIRGMEIRHPEHEKNLDLLERCGLIKSRIKYTEHNTYREYLLTEEGTELIQKECTL
ncbi:MAG: hypothetical protein K6T73_09745 [Candidatus Bathyarchaeota archaeon]|nr:hypothetical protein [Candidatus Bathyarchaeota archaeon]